MTLTPLLPLMYEPLVRTALLEDLGRAGDVTSIAISRYMLTTPNATAPGFHFEAIGTNVSSQPNVT